MIKTKVPNPDHRDSQVDARIPSEYFLPQSEEFRNNKSYLPNGFLNSNSRSSSPFSLSGSSKSTLYDAKNSNFDYDDEADKQNNKKYKVNIVLYIL